MLINLEQVIKYFFQIFLINTAITIIVAIPVLIPSLAFPILITEWPGIYMIIGFFSLIICGILGFCGWAITYFLILKIYKVEFTNKNLVFTQIVLCESGILLTAIFMYWGGYVGASAAHAGMAEFIIGEIMEFAVVPSGLGIGLQIVGNLTGLINVFLTMKK